MRLLPFLFIVVVTAGATLAMLFLRGRHSPRAGFYADTESAAGVFGVVGTGFAVLLAFVIFAVFGSYTTARDTVGREAIAVRQMSMSAGYFAASDRDALRTELICYARAVAREEWTTMASEQESPTVDTWLERIQRSTERLQAPDNKRSAAFSFFLEAQQQRMEGRRGRLTEAAPSVPIFVWVVLVLTGLLVMVFVATFASPRERRLTQALFMASVAITVAGSLAAIWVLDRPFEDLGAEIEPTRMLGALSAMESELAQTAPGVPIPCDDRGQPTATS